MLKIPFTERLKGTHIELGFLIMLGVWAALARGWVLAFEHNFALDVYSTVPRMLNVFEANEYLIPKMGISMFVVGLLVGFKFDHGKAHVLAKLLAVFGLFQLISPLMLLAGDVTTDSKFAQFVVVVICMMLPISLAAFTVSFLLPKSQSAQAQLK
ncbi:MULTISPECIES: hypothetical protein [Vibrio]|uniref:hypothetical protein n=1 Tax=Vibrio TaxID=662 RepID=UPI000841DCF5|nr:MULTISPECIES: hypothetical protein [Vibrio]ODM56920.1 hypothetical protein BC455_17655 [Vibrio harveyi]USD58451.1 hypothetical protein J4N44_27545 [Vibrio sp. SCSIO 43155]